MKSSKRIVFEIGKESDLDKAVEILEKHNKKVARKAFKAGEHKGKYGDKHYLLIPNFNSYWKSKQL